MLYFEYQQTTLHPVMWGEQFARYVLLESTIVFQVCCQYLSLHIVGKQLVEVFKELNLGWFVIAIDPYPQELLVLSLNSSARA